MKRKFFILAFAAFMAGCSGHSAEQSIAETATAEPNVSCELSPLTNLCYDPSNPVLTVKIDDVGAARPQLALNAADVVIVEPVEAGLTRLMAVYNSSLPETVGPIRSARITDLDLATAFGQPGFAYSGSTSKLAPYIEESDLQFVGAPQGGDGYFRAEDRPAPHDYLATTATLIERIGSLTAAQLHATSYWSFGLNSESGKVPTEVEVIWASSKKTFRWEAASQSWTITSDGSPTYQQNPDGSLELVRTSTVFIQETQLLDSPFVFSSGTVTPYAQTIGTGNGWLLTRGQVFYVEWQRSTKTDLPIWLDKNGKELAIADGNLWWLIAPRVDTQVNLLFPATPAPSATVSADAG